MLQAACPVQGRFWRAQIGLQELNRESAIGMTNDSAAYAAALMTRYSFDLGGYTIDRLMEAWLQDYPSHWVRSAAIEALYQGRYKAVSVDQILFSWYRRGQPYPHFNREFERLIGQFPQDLVAEEASTSEQTTSKPKPAPASSVQLPNTTAPVVAEGNVGPSIPKTSNSEARLPANETQSFQDAAGFTRQGSPDLPAYEPIQAQPASSALPSLATAQGSVSSEQPPQSLEKSERAGGGKSESLEGTVDSLNDRGLDGQSLDGQSLDDAGTIAPPESQPERHLEDSAPEPAIAIATHENPTAAQLATAPQTDASSTESFPEKASSEPASTDPESPKPASTDRVEQSRPIYGKFRANARIAPINLTDADAAESATQHPIDQFTPGETSSEFYTKLKAVAQQSAAVLADIAKLGNSENNSQSD